uniref:Putative secreted protein n=1 Tax=Amblyomma americanum TaxID=6943 RepID=A0A0C9R3Y9_AMBAM
MMKVVRRRVLLTSLVVFVLKVQVTDGSGKTPVRDPEKCYSDQGTELNPKELGRSAPDECLLHYCDPENKTLITVTCAHFQSPCVDKRRDAEYPYCCRLPICETK